MREIFAAVSKNTDSIFDILLLVWGNSVFDLKIGRFSLSTKDKIGINFLAGNDDVSIALLSEISGLSSFVRH